MKSFPETKTFAECMRFISYFGPEPEIFWNVSQLYRKLNLATV